MLQTHSRHLADILATLAVVYLIWVGVERASRIPLPKGRAFCAIVTIAAAAVAVAAIWVA